METTTQPSGPLYLKGLVPPQSEAYCDHLIETYGIHLKVVKPRRTVLGTYNRQIVQGQMKRIIRINDGLSAPMFLVVFLHEVAHWLHDLPGSKELPHGPEWQGTFRRLLEPALTTDNFSPSQLEALKMEISHLHTGACFTPRLRQILDPDQRLDGLPELGQIKEGALFFHGKHPFVLLEKRRTRAICLELNEGRNLLVLMTTRVRLPDEHEHMVLWKLADKYRPLNTLQKNQQFVFLKQTYILLGPSPDGKTMSFKKPRGRVVYALPNEALVQVIAA